jgi:rubrerythrin
MDMSDLLRRCTRVEQTAGEIYDALARRFRADEPFSRFWAGLAEDERQHAKKLATWRRLLELEGKTSGRDLVGFSEGVEELERLTGQLRERAHEVETVDEAFALALSLETSELDTIYTMVLQSSPIARFPDLPETQRAEIGKHHEALLAMIRSRSTDERNLQMAALLDASEG